MSAPALSDILKPYAGPSETGVDRTSLTGKLMSGYQGWFRTPGDGWNNRWVHWDKDREFKPGQCKIDAWPDVSELDPDELAPTAFRHADGSVAHVFSSVHRKTVLRHFRWMRDYGHDGVFVQRFFNCGRDVREGRDYSSLQMLAHAREGANLYGRTYALMYDLSGMVEGGEEELLQDWRRLKDAMALTEDPAYLRHRGKPVVAVWGLGFRDRPDYGLASCARIVDFLKNDPRYGGNTVMLGVPTGWREQSMERPYVPFGKRVHSYIDGDCIQDPRLHEILKMADIVSPWAVDRARDLEGIGGLAENVWKGDLAWCRAKGLDFLPVAFPGFSWHNMFPVEAFNQTPRLKGAFLWRLYHEAARVGATMIYQAMFDEVDEGTAIFKCSNKPPVGASPFLDMEGVPSDHYLWLAGQATRLLKEHGPIPAKLPERPSA